MAAAGHLDRHRLRDHPEGIAKITIRRPEVLTPSTKTLFELHDAFELARDDPAIGVIVLTGESPDAFCSGGDQRIRGDDGYVDEHGIGRLNVLDLQIRSAAAQAGDRHGRRLRDRRRPRAPPGGTGSLAADNAHFGQTGPRMDPLDGGYGAWACWPAPSNMKATRSGCCAASTTRTKALEMGLVNTVVPLADLERVTVEWCRRILERNPLALRLLKAGLNADTDGLAGVNVAATPPSSTT